MSENIRSLESKKSENTSASIFTVFGEHPAKTPPIEGRLWSDFTEILPARWPSFWTVNIGFSAPVCEL